MLVLQQFRFGHLAYHSFYVPSESLHELFNGKFNFDIEPLTRRIADRYRDSYTAA